MDEMRDVDVACPTQSHQISPAQDQAQDMPVFKLSSHPPQLPSTTAAQKHEHEYMNTTTRRDNYPAAVMKGW